MTNKEPTELYDKIIDTVIRECDADYDQMIEVRDEKALKRKLRKIIKPFLSEYQGEAVGFIVWGNEDYEFTTSEHLAKMVADKFETTYQPVYLSAPIKKDDGLQQLFDAEDNPVMPEPKKVTKVKIVKENDNGR